MLETPIYQGLNLRCNLLFREENQQVSMGRDAI